MAATPLELQSGFSNYGSGFADAGFTNIGGAIMLEGLVIHDEFGNDQAPIVIAELPEAARPQASLPFDAFTGQIYSSQYASARVDVNPDGTIVFQGVTEAEQLVTLLSLNGISFPVEGGGGGGDLPEAPADAWIPLLTQGERYEIRLTNGHTFVCLFEEPEAEVTIIGRPSILVVHIGERTSWVNLNEIAMVSEVPDIG